MRASKEGGEFPAKLPGDDERRPVNTSREAVPAMPEVLKRKTGIVFARPEKLTPGTIREIRISFELIDRLRSFYCVGGEKPGRLSNETANETRQKALRIKEIPPERAETAAGENGWKEEKTGYKW